MSPPACYGGVSKQNPEAARTILNFGIGTLYDEST